MLGTNEDQCFFLLTHTMSWKACNSYATRTPKKCHQNTIAELTLCPAACKNINMFCRDYDVSMLTRLYPASYVTRQRRNVLDYSNCTVKRMLCRKIYIKITTSICTRPTIRQKGSHRVWHVACLQQLLKVIARPERNERLVPSTSADRVYIFSANTSTTSRYLWGYLNCWSLGNHHYNRTQTQASVHRPLRSLEENRVASPSLLLQRGTVLFMHARYSSVLAQAPDRVP